MRFTDVASRVAKFASDNSSTILTGLGVVGALTSVYLAGKASFRASQILDDQETRVIRGEEDELEPREKLGLVWHLYIPVVGSVAATVACIIAANRIDARRAAAMVAAYAISERAFDEYKDKIVEKLGERKAGSVRDEIARDRIAKNPPLEDRIVWEEMGGSSLCCDLFTGRYFISDMETIRRAENDINYQINNSFYASLTDFYERIGLDRTSMSDDFGWNSDKPLTIHFSPVLTPSGRPCLAFDFTVLPIRGYARVQ